YFMDKIVDHLFIFQGDGTIEDFPGNYTDYRVYATSQLAERREQKANAPEKTEKSKGRERERTDGLSYMEQKEYKQLEKDIQGLEERKLELQNTFADPGLKGDEIDRLSMELKEVSDAIDLKTERWFELSSRMEE